MECFLTTILCQNTILKETQEVKLHPNFKLQHSPSTFILCGHGYVALPWAQCCAATRMLSTSVWFEPRQFPCHLKIKFTCSAHIFYQVQLLQFFPCIYLQCKTMSTVQCWYHSCFDRQKKTSLHLCSCEITPQSPSCCHRHCTISICCILSHTLLFSVQPHKASTKPSFLEKIYSTPLHENTNAHLQITAVADDPHSQETFWRNIYIYCIWVYIFPCTQITVYTYTIRKKLNRAAWLQVFLMMSHGRPVAHAK